MLHLSWFVSTLILFELIIHLDAKKCPAGKMVSKGDCEVCPEQFYQSEPNESNKCTTCTGCDEGSGSFILRDCKPKANRLCMCREGFVPRDSDSSTCKCDIGSGKKNRECIKCKDGFFNDRINSPCKEWRKCSAGVNKTGTATSDNICNKESKPYVTTITTSKILIPPNKPEGAEKAEEVETSKKQNKSTTVAAEPAPRDRVTPKHQKPPSTDSHIGVILIACVVALLILTAVICKLYISPCARRRKPAVPAQDSLCRRPVEESGDGSQSSLKQYSEEP